MIKDESEQRMDCKQLLDKAKVVYVTDFLLIDEQYSFQQYVATYCCKYKVLSKITSLNLLFNKVLRTSLGFTIQDEALWIPILSYQSDSSCYGDDDERHY